MPDTSLTKRQESLLSHLESVYLLAQTVSSDAQTAARLVEAAYTQAFVTLPLSNPARNEKRWLFRLLLQIRHEQAEFERHTAEEEARAQAPPAALTDLRRRLARQIASRALPTTLTTLPDDQRLILLLCDAEGLSCDDAAFVLAVEAETACESLEQARAAVNDTLRAGVSEQERRLLVENLPDDWLRPTLRRTVEAEFDLPPSTLRHAIVASTLHPTAEPASEPASETPPPLDAPAATEDKPSRPQATPPKRTKSRRLSRVAFMVLLFVAVAAVSYLASDSFVNRPPETNLITLSVKQADAVQPSLETDSPEEAEAYVQDQLQWRLTLPSIDQAALSGVGLREVAPAITVPVFLYQDAAGETAERIALYVFSYTLLDQHDDRLKLEPEIQQQITDTGRFDLHDLGKRNVLVWRHRDDIFVAVTPGDPEALRQRIVFPS